MFRIIWKTRKRTLWISCVETLFRFSLIKNAKYADRRTVSDEELYPVADPEFSYKVGAHDQSTNCFLAKRGGLLEPFYICLWIHKTGIKNIQPNPFKVNVGYGGNGIIWSFLFVLFSTFYETCSYDKMKKAVNRSYWILVFSLPLYTFTLYIFKKKTFFLLFDN